MISMNHINKQNSSMKMKKKSLLGNLVYNKEESHTHNFSKSLGSSTIKENRAPYSIHALTLKGGLKYYSLVINDNREQECQKK